MIFKKWLSFVSNDILFHFIQLTYHSIIAHTMKQYHTTVGITL